MTMVNRCVLICSINSVVFRRNGNLVAYFLHMTFDKQKAYPFVIGSCVENARLVESSKYPGNYSYESTSYIQRSPSTHAAAMLTASESVYEWMQMFNLRLIRKPVKHGVWVP